MQGNGNNGNEREDYGLGEIKLMNYWSLSDQTCKLSTRVVEPDFLGWSRSRWKYVGRLGQVMTIITSVKYSYFYKN